MNFANRTLPALACLMLMGVLASALGANTAPSAASMAAGVYQNDILEFYAPGVLTNASDPENDPLTAALLVSTQNGSLTLNPDGSFSYTPAWGYSGPDSFQFAAFDGSLYSAPATFDITVIAVNTPPQVVSRSYDAVNDAAFLVAAPGVLLGVIDPDSSSFTALQAGAPTYGTLTLNADGSFVYVPQAGFIGSDSFTFQADDGTALSLPGTITINVTAPNQPPVGANVTLECYEDTLLDGAAASVAGYCSDPDGDALVFTLDVQPQDGALRFNADGSFSYMPAPECSGTVTFSYTVADAMHTSGPYVVKLDILPVNDAPNANDDAYTLLEDQVLTVGAGGVLDNDGDIEGDVISAVATSLPQHGKLAINADGSFEYAPEQNFNGYDSFTYYADDGQGQSQIVTVTLFVQEMNDAPGYSNAGDVTVNEDDGEVKLQWAKDIMAGPADESGQACRFEIAVSGSTKLFTVDPVIDESGMLSFELAPNAWGTADVTVILRDDGGMALAGERDYSDPLTFRIFVVAMNDAPSFIPGGNVKVLEDCGAQAIAWARQISAGAGDVPQQLAFVVTGNSNAALFADGPWVDQDGVLRFTPAANANGDARISLILAESGFVNAISDQTSIEQSFVLSVVAVNDAPVFYAGPTISVRGHGNSAITGWAAGISAGPADEQGQMLTIETLSVDNPGLFEIQPRVDSMGTLYFKPRRGAEGMATITLMLVDDGGTENGGQCNSEIKTFSIEVSTGEIEAEASCTAGAGAGPWWLWLAVPALLAGTLRRRRAA